MEKQSKIELLKKALAREKLKRRKAENIAETRSYELYNANLELSKTNDTLEQQVADRTLKYKKSIDEKNILLKEIHHRVKNNLQIISSLINLQSSYLKNEDEKFHPFFKDTQNRIKTLALIHEKLYKSSDIEHIKIESYIQSLVKLLGYSFEKNNIIVTYHFDNQNDNEFEIEKAIPCGLIINEIISNSFKHGFKKKTKGEINLSMSTKDDNHTIIIKDNGDGINEEININESKSLGFQLIKALTRQLNGNIFFENDNGLKTTLKFPKN